MTPNHTWSRAGAAVLLGLALLAGCDRPLEPRYNTVSELERLGPGIHPVMAVRGSGNSIEAQIHLKAVKVEGGIASYQGELRYDVAVLTLKGARVPEGVLGAWNETSPGVLRFAGAAMDGLGGRPVLTLQLSGPAQIGEQAFSVNLESVTTPGFESLMDRVQAREHPLLVRGQLDAPHGF